MQLAIWPHPSEYDYKACVEELRNHGCTKLYREMKDVVTRCLKSFCVSPGMRHDFSLGWKYFQIREHLFGAAHYADEIEYVNIVSSFYELLSFPFDIPTKKKNLLEDVLRKANGNRDLIWIIQELVYDTWNESCIIEILNPLHLPKFPVGEDGYQLLCDLSKFAMCYRVWKYTTPRKEEEVPKRHMAPRKVN